MFAYFVPEMAEDFDVEAMLEAPYKKGVSYIHIVDIMMVLEIWNYKYQCRFIILQLVFWIFILNCIIIAHKA